MKRTLTNLRTNRRLQLFVASAVIIADTSSVVAFNSVYTATAENVPITTQLDDHDKQITQNESDIAQKSDRAENIEQQTSSNTESIHQVERQLVVVEGEQEAATKQAKTQAPINLDYHDVPGSPPPCFPSADVC